MITQAEREWLTQATLIPLQTALMNPGLVHHNQACSSYEGEFFPLIAGNQTEIDHAISNKVTTIARTLLTSEAPLYLAGSVARRLTRYADNFNFHTQWIQQEPSTIEAAAAQSEDPETKQYLQEVARRLQNGPYDIDFVQFTSDPEKLLAAAVNTLSGLLPDAPISRVDFGTSGQAVSLVLPDFNRPVTIDIIALNSSYLMEDYRYGPNQSQKQRHLVPITNHFGDPVIKLERNKNTPDPLTQPSRIDQVSYHSLDQALIAGLRLIFQEQCFPGVPFDSLQQTSRSKRLIDHPVTDRIHPETILQYRTELSRLAHTPDRRPDDSLARYRKAEIGGLLVQTLSLQTEDAVRMMAALGILDTLYGFSTTDTNYIDVAENCITQMRKQAKSHFPFYRPEGPLMLSWIDFIEAVKAETIGKSAAEQIAKLLAVV